MKVVVRIIVCVLAVVSLLAGPGTGSAGAQIPEQFTNLKVLPKDISKRDLVSVMKDFTNALGVRCKHCHVPGADPNSLEGFDFASDEPKHKLVAREMMKMVGSINADFIGKAGIESPTQVRCMTCHRGVDEPETLDRLLLGVARKDGVPAAESKYRELRADFYGTGSYDFSPGSLQTVADGLAREKNLEGAIAMARVNLEFNPDDAQSHAGLAQLLAAAGNSEEAVKEMERAIELAPEEDWYKQMLEKIRTGN